MSNPTSNFGWQMPTATDLVTDLPADFEVFGQAVDTALMDLKGGTTGQVLKKNTNADMDFVWGADSAGMTNPMTTTGDIIYSSSGSTPARLGIGTTGQVLNVTAGIPAWTTVSSGGMTQLATGTLSGSTLSVTSLSGSYKDLQIIVRGATMTSGGFNLEGSFNSDTTSSRHAQRASFTSPASGIAFTGSNVASWLSSDTTNSKSFAVITIYDYANTSTWKMGNSYGISQANGDSTVFNYYASTIMYNQTGAITSWQFDADGGTFNGGTYIIYGVK
jgi:hypothetical protein